MNEGLPLPEPAQADQKVWCQKTPMDRPIKVPSWWVNNWLHNFSCSHRATFFFFFLQAIFISNYFFFISLILRTTGDTELTTLVIAFFALAGLAIPLLTLLKMTDFPFWISESRTSIKEPVKLFFLSFDAILMTQHFLAQKRGSVPLYCIILGVEYANLLSSCTCT